VPRGSLSLLCVLVPQPRSLEDAKLWGFPSSPSVSHAPKRKLSPRSQILFLPRRRD
jgi:hypothetical protein